MSQGGVKKPIQAGFKSHERLPVRRNRRLPGDNGIFERFAFPLAGLWTSPGPAPLRSRTCVEQRYKLIEKNLAVRHLFKQPGCKYSGITGPGHTKLVNRLS